MESASRVIMSLSATVLFDRYERVFWEKWMENLSHILIASSSYSCWRQTWDYDIEYCRMIFLYWWLWLSIASVWPLWLNIYIDAYCDVLAKATDEYDMKWNAFVIQLWFLMSAGSHENRSMLFSHYLELVRVHLHWIDSARISLSFGSEKATHDYNLNA
jgi:hypothetical protein